jgi:hypothetical protein
MNLKTSPRDYTPVDFTKFKSQFSAADIAKITARPGGSFRLPIVTLSPIKTIGQGKTYVTLNNATDFEPGAGAWGGTPYAKFEKGVGYSEMHFEQASMGLHLSPTTSWSSTLLAIQARRFSSGDTLVRAQ